MTIESGIELCVQSRFSVSKTPVVAPGKCIVCGFCGDGNRDFIDFGMQFDWYGAVYFCGDCITEAHQALGFVPTVKFTEARDLLETQRRQNEKLTKNYNDLRTATRGILASCKCGDEFDYPSITDVELPFVEDDEAVPVGRAGNGKGSSSK